MGAFWSRRRANKKAEDEMKLLSESKPPPYPSDSKRSSATKDDERDGAAKLTVNPVIWRQPLQRWSGETFARCKQPSAVSMRNVPNLGAEADRRARKAFADAALGMRNYVAQRREDDESEANKKAIDSNTYIASITKAIGTGDVVEGTYVSPAGQVRKLVIELGVQDSKLSEYIRQHTLPSGGIDWNAVLTRLIAYISSPDDERQCQKYLLEHQFEPKQVEKWIAQCTAKYTQVIDYTHLLMLLSAHI